MRSRPKWRRASSPACALIARRRAGSSSNFATASAIAARYIPGDHDSRLLPGELHAEGNHLGLDRRAILLPVLPRADFARGRPEAHQRLRQALRILRHPRVKPYVDLPRMSELADEMVRDALNAVVRRDVDLAQKVLASDDRVDHYRDQIFRELLTYMWAIPAWSFPRSN